MTTEARSERSIPQVISPAEEPQKFLDTLRASLSEWKHKPHSERDEKHHEFSLRANRDVETLSVVEGPYGIMSISLKIVMETPPSGIKHLDVKTYTLLKPQTSLFYGSGKIIVYGDNPDNPKDPKKAIIMEISPKGNSKVISNISSAK